MLTMFKVTCVVLDSISEGDGTSAQRGKADSAYDSFTSFDFILIMHIMKEILEISDMLCQTL